MRAIGCCFVALSSPVACNSDKGTAPRPAASADPWSAGSAHAPSALATHDDPTSPVGVWHGLVFDTGMHHETSTGDLQYNTKQKIELAVILPDGKMIQGAPWAGLADLDYAAWARDVEHDASLGGIAGTHTWSGASGAVTLSTGYREPIALAGGNLILGKSKLQRAKDVSGATLDGWYTWWTNAEDSSLAAPGCQPLVRFTDDGHFEDRGGFATPCTSPPDPDAPGSGTYELRDFSLILHYTDGRTVKHLITAVINGDLHSDTSRALIMGRAWARRAAPVAQADPSAAAPAPSAPPAAPVAGSGETAYDLVAFATPPGQGQRNKGALVFTDANGDQLVCMTAVFAGVPSAGDPGRDFAADWKQVVLDGRTADSSPSPQVGRSPHGLVFAGGGAMTTESSGVRVYRALFVFEVAGRRVSVMVVAPTEGQLAGCHLEDLLRTMRAA